MAYPFAVQGMLPMFIIVYLVGGLEHCFCPYIGKNTPN